MSLSEQCDHLSASIPAHVKWRNLLLLAFAELLAMVLWFSASAVVPQLTQQWKLGSAGQAWLTMSVQIGFVLGALASAILNLADRISASRLIGCSALLGAGLTALIAADPGIAATIALRVLTGVAMAGVYPPGMKLVASWCSRDRGLGIGLLVGALTIGSAVPHLLNAVPVFGAVGMPAWRSVLWAAAAQGAIGGVLVLLFVKSGPILSRAAAFDWRYAGKVFSNRPMRLANFGYLGHMWELYAVWTWAPFLLIASYEASGWSIAAARVAGFGMIAVGGAGSLLAGILADRLGRTRISIWSLAVSGACCLTVGFAFDHPALLTGVCLLWGFAVVADSAQFSAAVSELSDPRYVGTALTMQTSVGFLLTMITIQLIPPLRDRVGWEYAFALLAIGPALAIWSMAALRALPEATRMASGNM